MSYVDAFHYKNEEESEDKILVVERINGERILREVNTEYVFYYAHEKGNHLSIFGDKCDKFSSLNHKKFRNEMFRKREKDIKIFESDIKPVFRTLARDYMDANVPELNIGFFDIEADFHPVKGFAPTTDPFNAITSITIYQSHIKTNFTLALCPPTLTFEEATALGEKFDNTAIFDSEAEMLEMFLDLIEPVDVLTGWNSSAYDVPYLINRIKMVLGEEATSKLCLWDQVPRKRDIKDKYGRITKTYDLIGRVHLDYMDLYKKHNTQQRQSYALNSIGEEEVGESKTPYEGTLDDLYKKDFGLFLQYNRQDVMLLVKIDAKVKFIDLANQIAHANCTPLQTTMGSVALVEQAIINEMHKMGRIVPDRRPKDDSDKGGGDVRQVTSDDVEEERTPVVGAYVANPKTGKSRHVGCVDINSLYPSAIRALNMSPETVFGQVRLTHTMEYIARVIIERKIPKDKLAEAWEGIFCSLEVSYMQDKTDDVVTIDLEDGRVVQMTGAELYDFIFREGSNLCITANGTIFRTDVEGMIPALLKKWYAERKALQAKMKYWQNVRDKMIADGETWVPNVGGNSEEAQRSPEEWIVFYDQRQLAKKILLNSLYGALLNAALRFYDERLGQSVTLTGRSIVRHMNAIINEIITGVYDYRGESIVYADTDSCYFSAYQILKDQPEYADFEWTKESIIELYDGITEAANATFPEFMATTFNTSLERGSVIQAGRELVASTGYFIKKKKYAVLMYDKEGKRLDKDKEGNDIPGKLKVMGLDLKRADTPKFMQKFLESLLMDILTDVPDQKMFDDIKAFRKAFIKRPGWEKGMPRKVSNLSGPEQLLKEAAQVGLGKIKDGQKLKVDVAGHARAAINWNKLCDMNNDKHAIRITDGARIIVCKLKPNAMKFDSIAYPVDEPHLPQWFKELPFDHTSMEEKIIDAKLENLVGTSDTGLKWNLDKTKERPGDDIFKFG